MLSSVELLQPPDALLVCSRMLTWCGDAGAGCLLDRHQRAGAAVALRQVQRRVRAQVRAPEAQHKMSALETTSAARLSECSPSAMLIHLFVSRFVWPWTLQHGFQPAWKSPCLMVRFDRSVNFHMRKVSTIVALQLILYLLSQQAADSGGAARGRQCASGRAGRAPALLAVLALRPDVLAGRAVRQRRGAPDA